MGKLRAAECTVPLSWRLEAVNGGCCSCQRFHSRTHSTFLPRLWGWEPSHVFSGPSMQPCGSPVLVFTLGYPQHRSSDSVPSVLFHKGTVIEDRISPRVQDLKEQLKSSVWSPMVWSFVEDNFQNIKLVLMSPHGFFEIFKYKKTIQI